MLQVTSNNYQKILSSHDTIHVIEFYSKLCGHCKMLQKELEELSRDSGEDIIFGRVDIEEEQFLFQKYDISSVPTILFIKNGEMKEKLVGYYPKVIINENIKKIK